MTMSQPVCNCGGGPLTSTVKPASRRRRSARMTSPVWSKTSRAVAAGAADGRALQQRGDVRRLVIFYRAVGRALYLAPHNDVPQRDAVRAQKGALLRHVRRERFAEKGGEHLPESVLPVPVIKALFPARHRRKAAEDEHAALRRVFGRKTLYSVTHSTSSFAKFRENTDKI